MLALERLVSKELARSTFVVDLSAFCEQIVLVGLGQGAPWCPARRGPILEVVEYPDDKFRLGEVCDDRRHVTVQYAQCDFDFKNVL